MKKLGILIVTLALLALFVFGVSAAALGDVDADGSVTAADARLALRRAVELETFARGGAQYTAADADRDGTVTAADARLILRAAVGLEELEASLPIKFFEGDDALPRAAEYDALYPAPELGANAHVVLMDNRSFTLEYESHGYATDHVLYVRLGLVNKEDQPVQFYLSDFEVNGVMIDDCYSVSLEDYLVPALTTRTVTVIMTDESTPEDFSFTPFGECYFNYSVTAWDPVADMPIQEIDYGVAYFCYEDLKDERHYEPSYPDSFYDMKNDDLRFGFYGARLETWAEPNDAYGMYLFYQNLSDSAQYVTFEITAVNGKSIVDGEGYGEGFMYMVLPGCSAVVGAWLNYDTFGEMESVLNSLGIKPEEVTRVDYKVNVWDVQNPREVYSGAWTIE